MRRSDELVTQGDAEIAYLHACRGIAASAPDRGGDVVELRIDGRQLFVLFELNESEHERRQAARVGAATSTGLLHALWELPEGERIRWDALQERDASTLRLSACGHVEDGGECAVRRYHPPGSVHLLAVVDPQLKRAVRSVGGQAAVFLRLAIWSGRDGNPSRVLEHVQVASRYGLGVVSVSSEQPEVILHPRRAELGVPSVFRWWVCELAYRNWATRTEPTEAVVPWAR